LNKILELDNHTNTNQMIHTIIITMTPIREKIMINAMEAMEIKTTDLDIIEVAKTLTSKKIFLTNKEVLLRPFLH
jgi:hypothetical protein